MERFKFTKKAVENAAPPAPGATTSKGTPITQAFYWDTETKGLGLRVSGGGTRSFIYQGRLNGKVVKVSIGRPGDAVVVTIKGQPETLPLTVENARKKVTEIQGELQKGNDPRRTRPARAKPGEEPQDTLGHLLTAYCDLLQKAGKVSAGKVRQQIRKDVEKAHPKLWNKRAAEVTIDDCMAIIQPLFDSGKPRQADKIRTYIKAAYRRALNARGDTTTPQVMRAMRLTSNPAGDIGKVPGSSNVNERVLSLAEFRAYWRRLQELPEPRRSVAMLHCMTGGQRMAQLARVTLADIDRDALLLTLRDSKGRRAKPRVYQVPLRPEALDCIDAVTGAGDYVFSADGGLSPMSDQFISDIAASVCEAMAEAGELEGTPFTGKQIRATVETRLMDEPFNVSSDVLARLLSHGMGGVQARHYARDPLLNRQRDAVDKLWRLLNDEREPVAEVVQLRAQA
ncbi:MAG: integrase [Haliea sp.]|nr:integrase [Haliea sp.]